MKFDYKLINDLESADARVAKEEEMQITREGQLSPLPTVSAESSQRQLQNVLTNATPNTYNNQPMGK
tara:strand:+ start:7224 stop:7424 length:201 start_codon:yes stop_codon:yes gene_type:complete